MPPRTSVPPVSDAKKAATIYSCTKPGLMAITYDDGPSTFAPGLLDLLSQNNVKVTFFLNAFNQGDLKTATYTAWLKKAVQLGHQIASHTYDHLDLTKLDTYGQYAQMQRNDAVFQSIMGKRPIYMRPPFGAGIDNTNNVLTNLGSWGYKVIWKNIDNMDTQHATLSEANQLKQDIFSFKSTFNTQNKLKDSYIALNHDFLKVTSTQWTQKMINYGKAAGYKFVTVGECLGEPEANWYRV